MPGYHFMSHNEYDLILANHNTIVEYYGLMGILSKPATVQYLTLNNHLHLQTGSSV